MNEFSSVKSSSSLAITERKSYIQKTGGCVGIFFQLFDWNRRFAKKKFFPKKLLTPGRTKVSKKFNADEKLPVTKHLLIAEENSGGFPSKMKKKNGDYKLETKKHEMQSPGLVARLMGLEAMPVVVVDEFDKSSSKFVELSPEKANVRPQKLQKTGASERRPVTRFGAEALQIKSVLSRSRKHHYQHPPKLVSPVKSPKMGRSGSRLIDVAARVLEPGRQASNRARCSLSYPSSPVTEVRKEDLMNDVIPVSSEERGCRNCGNVFGPVMEQSRDFDELGYDFRDGRSRPFVYLENENDVVLLKTTRRYEPECIPSQSEDSTSVQTPSQRYDQIPVSRIFTSQKDTSRPTSVKSRLQRPGQVSPAERIPPKSKLANSHSRRVLSSSPVNDVAEGKDFIALNRNISRSKLRVPNKPDNGLKGERMFQTGKNDSLTSQRNPVRKRTVPGSSSFEKRRNDGIHTSTVNEKFPRTRQASQRGTKETVPTDVVSFTFNSPVKRSPVRKRDVIHSIDEEDVKESIMEVVNAEQSSRNHSRMNGDALGDLLEQKLKELTHQVENEAAAGFTPSSRTTASILQELISALTMERPISSEGRDFVTNKKDSECSDISDRISQANSSNKRSSDGMSRGIDHFSPGCVLDASFSNESCISSSIDESSVKLAPPDADLSDSASSTNPAQKPDIKAVTDLVTHTSAVLNDVKCVHAKLIATKRDYMQEIVLNAELLFGNAANLHSSSRFIDFLFGPFLDELETLVIAAWKNSIILGIEVKKEENPLRRFLLDCLVESLDVKYSRYINSGFRTWSRLPKTVNADVLIKEFDEEVRKWISFAGKTPDEIIEREMGSSLGKWTDFELEAFENGVEINQEIVQSLVDEIVTDLCATELSFCC
ncbi:hypothetical protein RND81_10G122300 [Saponaria officinalis]|uniref:DUF4378 domain-containing protein n=1 Tax=Saponaria officinalis TaxID=3572 RepID=A0AAW1I3Q6_SAPOF